MSNFLLVDLNETKTKKLAETITSATSRKILNHLTNKDDSEANISKELKIPISTVHYHLQKLQEAQLVVVDEFHYSSKGREVNHYKLANKYIIIAPKKVSGLREKLKGILPVGLIVLGISGVIKIVQSIKTTTFSASTKVMAAPAMEAASMDSAEEVALALQPATTQIQTFQPDIALWFLIGSITTLIIYMIISWIKELRNKK